MTSPGAQAPRRAAIYLRISLDQHGDGLAVSRQREDCEAIVSARGWTIEGVYEDRLPASDRRKIRPDYRRLLADYEAGKFDAIVSWDLDRLTRQPSELETLIALAEDRGLVIVTANGEADLGNDNGRLFARIKASVAKSEVERKGVRQRRANLQRSASGRPVPTRRRYGYESDGMTPRESEAAVVRRAFAHVAAGGSLRSLQLALELDHVDPAPGRSWSPRRLRDLLLNPHYAGQIRHLGETRRSDVVAPLVEPSLAETVRAVLLDPTRRTSVGTRPRHLASGISRCGVCGAHLVFMRAYRCRTDGSHPAITETMLDNRIREEIARALIAGGAAMFEAPQSEQLVPLVAAHARNLAAVEQTAADRDEGLVPEAVARARLVDLRVKRTEIEGQIERARLAESDAVALHEVARALFVTAHEISMQDYADGVAAVLESFDALDLDAQREVVRSLLTIRVFPGRSRDRVQIEHRLAPHLNLDAPLGVAETGVYRER